jgi:hypothetical protein
MKTIQIILVGLQLAAGCAAETGDDDTAGDAMPTPDIGTSSPFMEDEDDDESDTDSGVDAGLPEDEGDDDGSDDGGSDDGGDDIEPTEGCIELCETFVTCEEEAESEVEPCAQECSWELELTEGDCLPVTEALNACIAALSCEEIVQWEESTAETYPCQAESEAWETACGAE